MHSTAKNTVHVVQTVFTPSQAVLVLEDAEQKHAPALQQVQELFAELARQNGPVMAKKA